MTSMTRQTDKPDPTTQPVASLHHHLTAWLAHMEIPDVRCLLIDQAGAPAYLTLTGPSSPAADPRMSIEHTGADEWTIDSAPDDYRDVVHIPALTTRDTYRLAQGFALGLTR